MKETQNKIARNQPWVMRGVCLLSFTIAILGEVVYLAKNTAYMFDNYSFTVKDRFLRYVTIDTQSNPQSKTQPSTDKQKNLGRLLVQELLELGVRDAHLDEYGYVYGTIPANPDKSVPVICFCAHMDTAPDCSGTNVKPIVHMNYD